MCQPSLSEGFVGLDENVELIPITVVRDTGATQSLLVENMLPLSGHSSSTSALLVGVGGL